MQLRQWLQHLREVICSARLHLFLFGHRLLSGRLLFFRIVPFPRCGAWFLGQPTWKSMWSDYWKITLLPVIPTMTFIDFLTGKSSGILSDISSGILSGISSGILSGKSSGIYLAYLLAYYLANLLGFYLAYLVAVYLIFYLAFYLAYLLAFYLAYLLAFYLVYLLTFYLAYLLAFYLPVEVQQCTLSWEGLRLMSSGAHWAGQVPGWGPAVHTGLGRSQVEVQRCTLSWDGPWLTSSGDTELARSQVEVQWCTLSWEGPRLRSSGARWAGQVPGWGPSADWAGKLAKSLAKRVGKELGEELARRKWRWKLMQTWSRRN